MYTLIIVMDLILSIVGYYVCAESFSLGYNIYAMVLFFVAFLTVLLARKRKNYFTFEVIFSVCFFFVYYLYPVFGYLSNKYRYIFPFDANFITKCTLLASIGYSAFALGIVFMTNVRVRGLNRRYVTAISDYKTSFYHVLIVGSLICLALTIIQMIVLRANRYTGASDEGIWGYIRILKGGFRYASLTMIFYRLMHSNARRIVLQKLFFFWVTLFVDCLIMALSGYRAIPLGYAIIMFAGYALIKQRMPLRHIIILMCIGIVMLYSLMLLRSEGRQMFRFNIFSLTSDLVTNNYTSFVSYEYVKENGNTLFPLIGSLCSMVPFLLGFVVRTLGIPGYYVSSAEFLTFSVIGKTAAESVGLGTNIVASIYLSVGTVGVVVLMYCYGKYISFISKEEKAVSIYRLLLYMVMMAVSVYQVRADYFYQVVFVLWSYIFLKVLIRLVCYRVRVVVND